MFWVLPSSNGPACAMLTIYLYSGSVLVHGCVGVETRFQALALALALLLRRSQHVPALFSPSHTPACLFVSLWGPSNGAGAGVGRAGGYVQRPRLSSLAVEPGAWKPMRALWRGLTEADDGCRPALEVVRRGAAALTRDRVKSLRPGEYGTTYPPEEAGSWRCRSSWKRA